MINRERVDGWCERAILWMVVAALIVGPLAMGAVNAFEFLAIQALTIGAVCLWGVRLWLARSPKLLWPPVCWAVLAFVLLAIGRYLTCDIEYVGRLELIRILIYGLLFLVIMNNMHRQDSVQVVAIALVTVATLISCYAFYQFVTHSNKVWGYISPYKNRASGTYISPNHLGGLLEMVFPLGLAFCIAGRMKAWARILLGYVSLVMLAALALTLSRGAWLAVVVATFAFIVLLLTLKPYRLPALLLLAVFGAGGVLVFAKATFIQQRVERILVNQDPTLNVRFQIWEAAWRMWQDQPVWGVGPGHFNSLFRAYRPQGVQLQPDWVHNDYLNTLADWGIVGAVIVIAAWVLLGLGVLKAWRALRPQAPGLGPSTGSNRFAFILGGSVALLAVLVHSWVDFNMHIPANALICVSLMALLASHIRFTSRQHWHSAGLALKLLLTLMLTCGVGYLGWQGVRRAREATWILRANRKPLYSPEETACLRTAFQVEPGNAHTAYRVGEAYRVDSLQGREDYRPLAEQAMEWYRHCMRLNPWDGYGFLRYGTCLDWIGRKEESEPFFVAANKLDPSGYYSVANIGMHYVELRDYPAAAEWFMRSLKLKRLDNDIAQSYLAICEARILEAATNSQSLFLK